jgi:heme exporter protein CcmD
MIESLMSFIDMGGYARFIWPSWGFGLGVIIIITIVSRRQSTKIKARLSAMGKDY